MDSVSSPVLYASFLFLVRYIKGVLEIDAAVLTYIIFG